MKMIRFISTTLALFSLLLCLAAVGCWVRSYVAFDSFHWYGEGRELDFMQSRGQFVCYRVWSTDITNPDRFSYFHGTNSRGFGNRLESVLKDPGLRSVGGLGIVLVYGPPSYGQWFMEIWLPWWLITLATAIAPAMWFRRWRRRRSRPPGSCQQCGYDLRATPTRCPECGHVPTAAA